MPATESSSTPSPAEPLTIGHSPLDWLIGFCLKQKLVVLLITLFFILWGIRVAPFDWDLSLLPRDPVAVDAIPDLGENQQIVFTEWAGRSPQDVEDQVTYPLTVALLGTPGVKTVRSYSYFGFSSIYVIFQEQREYYWTRSRLLEKLSSLPADTLPPEARPMLGPDATALGQVFWYTLEGRDPEGQPLGGWDLAELRSIQDFQVRYALAAAEGVAEVAAVGGYEREYQVDVDPAALRAFGVTLNEVFDAVRRSNVDVGARSIEINRVEYLVRGRGFIRSLDDIRQAVVREAGNTPVTIAQVAQVTLGPAMRRGGLDKDGAEAVGGVVVSRYGANPLQTIKNVKAKIAQVQTALPSKAVINWDAVDVTTVNAFAHAHGLPGQDTELTFDEPAWRDWLGRTPRGDWPHWLSRSQVTIVPFYDRAKLIGETLQTLNDALVQQVLITIVVVIVMTMHLRSSLLISAMLPLAVLITFIAMKLFGIEANLVALAGIAIAIGTVVDMGIVLTENIVTRLREAGDDADSLTVVWSASSEVGGAVLTAIATTVVGFLPVFFMIGPEGKLFRPLAFTKTFALVASVITAMVIIPTAAHILLGRVRGQQRWYDRWAARVPAALTRYSRWIINGIAAVAVVYLLAADWLPLGPNAGSGGNFIFVLLIVGGLLLTLWVFRLTYGRMLRWCLDHKLAFLSIPLLIVLAGASVWLGFDRIFGFIPALAQQVGIGSQRIRATSFWVTLHHALPGLGKEFMPALDEGSFLFMPTIMPHGSIGEALDVVAKLDRAISAIPEVEQVVGKIGRAESPLDPAPVTMLETIIHYKAEYARDEQGQLVRQWREHIHTPDDIWQEITAAAQLPGSTGAPKLQPIETRLVMLQTGMRAAMGVKVAGPSLPAIEQAGLAIERLLRQTPGIPADSVNADRIVGQPYLEIEIDRAAAARFGVNVLDVQQVIETAIGGQTVTTTVEGRQRYGVRVRYLRELRDSIESMREVLIPISTGGHVPLSQVATIHYVRGPMTIKSEDTQLIGYVTFGKDAALAEVDVVRLAQKVLADARQRGELVLPAGVSYSFAGTYEHQLRAARTLAVVLPVALFVIFILLYLQFRSVSLTTVVFSGIVVAWAGGFLLIWLYGQPWFLDSQLLGIDWRRLFSVHSVNLSVAVWVGFLALFGIASDDGVVIATYLKQSFAKHQPTSIAEARQAALEAGLRRVRPCLMTTATTILALLPILTATGRGSDLMLPMALPSIGGMTIELITMFIVPTLYCWLAERKLRG